MNGNIEIKRIKKGSQNQSSKIIDDVMSDDSINPVQNKVIKEYIDEQIANVLRIINEMK